MDHIGLHAFYSNVRTHKRRRKIRKFRRQESQAYILSFICFIFRGPFRVRLFYFNFNPHNRVHHHVRLLNKNRYFFHFSIKRIHCFFFIIDLYQMQIQCLINLIGFSFACICVRCVLLLLQPLQY